MKRIVVGLVLAILATGVTVTAAEPPRSGIDTSGFDTKVRPQDDLFLHVNGRWLQTTEIPADKSSHGSFSTLDDISRENVRAILEDAVKNPTDATSRKVGNYFSSLMNLERIEQLGIEPLKHDLAAIDKLKSVDDVVRYFGSSGVKGLGSPIGLGIGVDDKNSSRYLVLVVQHGLTLPDRDFYLEDKESYQKARKALTEYIIKLYNLAKIPHADVAAESVLKLETALARIFLSKVEMRDANRRYNLYSVEKLKEITPKIPWATLFSASGVGDIKEVNVTTPSYFEGLEALLHETSLETWKYYLKFRLLDATAEYLPDAFGEAHFELHSKTISGVPTRKPRWKRSVDKTSLGVMSEAVGQLYVAKHFPPESKRRMEVLVGNLLKAYESSIHELTWMTDATKTKALEKLSKITTKIGYPEEWRDYTKLEVRADDALGNVFRTAEFDHYREVARLNGPVDRKEWHMPPQRVNAYYNPTMNEIVFPAAILQPPFFDPTADDAVNYGGIGVVIGHEISHAFDDQGSKYDGAGNLANWWTDADRKAYQELTQKLVAQYASYEPIAGRRLNGELTLGENIADLSGLAISYKAHQLSLAGKKGAVIDGLTPQQRLFVGCAQIWRIKLRPSEIERRIVTDPHSPPMFRVNGSVINQDAFYEAFQVKPGDKMYKPKEERIKIW